MTTTSNWRRARCVLVVAGLASASTLLTGCVSAVDESSAFGFSNPPKPNEAKGGPSIAEVIASDGKVAEQAEAPAAKDGGEAREPSKGEALKAVASSDAARRIAEASKPASKDMLVAAASRAIEPGKARSLLTPMSGPAVTAFAQPQRDGREADHSLYASLYTQAEAKVPLRNAEAGKSRRVIVHQSDNEKPKSVDNGLPGVDPKSLFEIGQRASVDSELIDDLGDSYQMASLSGIARLAPSGLMIQRQDVVTNCFDSNLMSLISQVEARFHQKVVITSGYRSPSHNRSVNGAKASLHMQCKAADLHVPGVNGQEVARFVRALPMRGGVGTYCHTAAIHIDVGPRRDWNWPCRSSRRAT
ncbi:YcbK family protein [Aureimonas sp. AU40]|uniref:YcbK family protein n=1 Tax=Aureimonas sp. AU40 TaxID=1637747 RepID=UPI000AD0B0E6|nr:D-Ala-D-Ala carboxypeptidase family metallohydrolase [Aureimonas sp. AU40]